MSQGKQAKVLSDRQVGLVLRSLETTRYPERDRVLFLLSVKAGLRAKEIARLTWRMVTEAQGQVGDTLALEDHASKGRSGRPIPLHRELRTALQALHTQRGKLTYADWPVIYSERGRGMSANSVAHWFGRLYRGLGFSGCSSHSGRRTFITKAARKIVEAGGSLRDVQQLAGHTSLHTTQRYVEGDSEAKRRVIELI